MYYVWETRVRRPTDVIVPKFPPVKSKYGVSFLKGRRFVRDLPELEFRYAAPSGSTLTDDLVIRKRRCLVHSARLSDVLRRVGVNSIDYCPCRVVNETTGSVDRSYQAANLLDMIFCIDRAGSELDIDDEEPNEIWSIDRLQLLGDRLGDSLMFRLGERPNTVIVHELVKVAIESAGLTGPVFLPAEGYREYGLAQGNNPVNLIGTHDADPDGAAGWWSVTKVSDDDPEDEDSPGAEAEDEPDPGT